MTKIKIFKLLMLAFLISTSSALAQNSFDIKVGIAKPLSDLGSQDINYEKAGGAALGLNIALKYTYQLSDNGLGLFAGLDFNYNGLSKDIKNDIEDMFESIGLLGADYTYFNYYNIPLSAGLNYTYLANEKVALIGNGGITINTLKISDFIVEGSGIKVKSEYDMTSAIGFRIGGGVLLSKKIVFAIDYYGLGAHNITGKARSDGIPSEDIESDLSVSFMTIRLGYNF
jgi:hypothetical protein